MSREYWRSLHELEGAGGGAEANEPGPTEENVAATRRDFFRVMGASLAMATISSCRWPREKILPFASRPEGRTPGVPSRYASALELAGAAVGVLVTSYDGRPVKIEGNPLHPTSLGAADAFMQARALELYDPDRSKSPVRREGGQEVAATWDDFVAFAGPHFSALGERRGAGLAVLSEATSSPSMTRLRGRFTQAFPLATWHEWEPLSRDGEREGAALVFGGVPMRPLLHLDRADVIVSLDEDLLAFHPAALRYARDFAARRRAEDGTMSRLYAAESVLSLTGAAADHRLALAPSLMPALAAALIVELSRLGDPVDGAAVRALEGALGAAPLADDARSFAQAATHDLTVAGNRGLVVAGPRVAPIVHAAVSYLNGALDNRGAAVSYLEDPDPLRGSHRESIASLNRSMSAGEVGTLLILGGNPAYDAPADVDFAGALGGVATTIHLSLFANETSRRSSWHLPQAHPLETWGDVRAWDGTVSVVQPLIAPLYDGKTTAELVSITIGDEQPSGHEITRAAIAALVPAEASEAIWWQALQDGVVGGSAWSTSLRPASWDATLTARLADAVRGAGGDDQLELVFAADSSTHDGRFANNAWLQETPDPINRLVWDNAALVSPDTARSIGVRRGDVVTLACNGHEVEAPVLALPGLPANTVVAPLGYGRSAAGRVGDGVGFDAYRLRDAATLGFATGVTVARTGRRATLASTEDHHAINDQARRALDVRIAALVREGTLAEYQAHPDFAQHVVHEVPPAPLFRELTYEGEHQWGMVIDLSACIGCGACAVACQAENNVAVVGRDEVARGREMHWLRVDRYFAGSPDNPRVVFQPVACQHCENAPCEQVCPAAATMHSEEGLNQMVYNRCVGTRYCANNCPYKVRRFNYFNNFKKLDPVARMAFNPQVTVRSRGVMEKCSYCVQRIELAKIAAGNDRRRLGDGEVVPACAQTCPTGAITFGDLSDPESRVSGLQQDDRAYGILTELNTKPRTLYLARLRNPGHESEEG